jgi:hypothetical protein
MLSADGTIVFYRSDNGNPFDVQLTNETIWLSLNQMTELFERDKCVIYRHFRKIFRDGELVKEAVVARNATTASDGKTYQVEFSNLDGINSVGYRVNSMSGTRVRIRATFVLKEHLVKGYILNQRCHFDNKALVALTLLLAASDPSQKDLLIKLIVNLLADE